jgi:hypothetical protein
MLVKNILEIPTHQVIIKKIIQSFNHGSAIKRLKDCFPFFLYTLQMLVKNILEIPTHQVIIKKIIQSFNHGSAIKRFKDYFPLF